MSVYVDVVEAARTLDELLERAVAGEDVVITVDGRPRIRLERVDDVSDEDRDNR